tara:strand:+ start:630 stop:1169 length:540 start_codon:yes stop_codon:yes gene_type:complete
VKRLLLLFIPLVFFFGCDPDDDDSMLTYNCINDDCFAEEGGQYATLQDCLSVCDINSIDFNSIYTGNWNFKGNSFSYSGYYIYTPEAEWYSTSSSTTSYNDSTGSIQLGQNTNELIFKYCEACEPVVYNLNDSGEVWSESLGGYVGWTLTDSTFFNMVNPGPPSYSPSYSTYNIEGWKL